MIGEGSSSCGIEGSRKRGKEHDNVYDRDPSHAD